MNDAIHITVGPRDADFLGDTHRAIQSAVDYAAKLGGGTVGVLPGVYRLGNAVHLRSHIRLVGHGEKTVFLKNRSVATPLADDTDWYERRVTVADPTGFEVGGGVCLKGRLSKDEAWYVTKHTVVAVNGNELLLDGQTRKNFWTTEEASAATLFPLVTANREHDFGIENLTLNGNREENDELDGNYGGCVFIQDCKRVRIVGVRAENYNGDGISWQVCHDVLVADCVSVHHANLGIHPGSGSQRPVIRRNTIRDCNIGLFWCWGVRFGIAEENDIRDIRSHGVSIGHRDTNNVMRRNTIADCGSSGVLFRREEPATRAPHRNVIEENVIQDIGTAEKPGVGINVDAAVEGVVLRQNRFLDTKGAMRCGIRIGRDVPDIRCDANTFDGVATPVLDERDAAKETAK